MSAQQILCGPDTPDRLISLMGVSMKHIVPHPVTVAAPDDTLTIELSDGTILDKGRLSGYPGTQMSELAVDEYGTAYWLDPLDNRTDIADLLVRLNVDYVASGEGGIFKGAGELSQFYSDVLTRNDFTPSDRGLVHILPAIPTSEEERSITDITFDYGIKVSASSIYNSTYALYKALDRTIANIRDGFIWGAGAPDGSWFMIEYPEPIMVTGFFFTDFRGDYPLRNGTIEVSNDGKTWTVVTDDVNSSDDPQYIVPVMTKFIRAVSNTGGRIGIGRFNVLTSKLSTFLNYNIDSSWYDRDSVKVVETDTHFEVSELFSDLPNVDDFSIVTLDNYAELVSKVDPELEYSTYAHADQAIRFSEVTHNAISVKGNGMHFTVPKGHYVFEVEVVIGGTTTAVVRSFFTLVDLSSNVPLTSEFEIMTMQYQPIDVPTRLRFECFVPEGTKLALLERRNYTHAFKYASDLKAKMRITKLSDTSLGKRLMTSKAYTHENLLAQYDVNDLNLSSIGTVSAVYPESKAFNEDSRESQCCALYSSTAPSPSEPWWLEFTTPDAILPTTMTLTNRTITTGANEQRDWETAAVFVEIDGDWTQVSDVVTGKSEYGDHNDITLDLPQAVTKFRLEFYGRRSVEIAINTLRLHSDTRIRGDRVMGEVVKDNTGNNPIHDHLITDNSPVSRATLDDGKFIYFRADDTFNLHLGLFINANYISAQPVLERMVNGIPELVKEGLMNWTASIQPVPFESNLTPGLYRLSAKSSIVISNIYLEGVS